MKKLFYLMAMLCTICISTNSQTTTSKTKANVNDANNPLATIKTFSVHNIYSPSICGTEGSLNTTWLRYAQPIWRILIRASLPVNTINTPTLTSSGLGDFNMFATFIVTNPKSPNQFGLGPLVSMPTATHSSLGTGKWMAGIALAGYFASNKIFQCGFLATWQMSFAGKQEREMIHAASIQPFLMWQLGKGVYLRSTANTLLDFHNNNYLVPLGLGVGKVIMINKVVCNIFAEPQFAVYQKGIGMPEVQLFIGINTQF